jgi:hypothetical protein
MDKVQHFLMEVLFLYFCTMDDKPLCIDAEQALRNSRNFAKSINILAIIVTLFELICSMVSQEIAILSA